MLLIAESGVPDSGGIGSAVGSLPRLGRGGPVPLRLQCVCRFFAVPVWQGRHLAVWF